MLDDPNSSPTFVNNANHDGQSDLLTTAFVLRRYCLNTVCLLQALHFPNSDF